MAGRGVLGALLLLAAAAAQEPATLPKDPIRSWKYVRKDVRFDPVRQMEIEEVSLILEGEEAVAVDLDKKIFDLKGVKAAYFTEPERDKPSKEIDVFSDRGHYDNAARTLRLKDHVRVVKKHDDATPGERDTILTASSLLLRFNRMYQCPACKKMQPAAGRCAEHDLPLREATLTSVEADRDFEMTGPEGILSGEGLFTDDALNKDYHIAKNGFVELQGDASALAAQAQAVPPSEAKFSQIFSRGPLHVSGPEHARRITGEGGTRIDRIDSSGTLTIQAQTLVLDTLQPYDAKAGRAGTAELRDVDARGRVQVDGVLFADGTSFQSSSDTLHRVSDGKDLDRTTLTSTGDIPVHVATGTSTIESRSVVLNKLGKTNSGVSVFEDVVRSDLTAGTQHFSLACRHLETIAAPDASGKTTLTRIEARDRVKLGGLMSPGAAQPGASADAGTALADAFDWDAVARRGMLEGTPVVRITQGTSLITAPRVALESPTIIVLKGPKQLHLVQERDGQRDEYRATCDGDLVLDQGAHRLTMRNNCVIRTKDLLLHSDRVNAKLAETGGAQGLESLLALGAVNALRVQDHTMIYGDRLAFRFADQDLKVYGGPYAVADTGRWTTTQEEIRVYEKRNPKTGQMVRYTEMIGGRDPVHMEIEERPAAARGDEKK